MRWTYMVSNPDPEESKRFRTASTVDEALKISQRQRELIFHDWNPAYQEALRLARQYNKPITLQKYVVPGDLPMWRVTLGLIPKDEWSRVHPDGKVEPYKPVWEL